MQLLNTYTSFNITDKNIQTEKKKPRVYKKRTKLNTTNITTLNTTDITTLNTTNITTLNTTNNTDQIPHKPKYYKKPTNINQKQTKSINKTINIAQKQTETQSIQITWDTLLQELSYLDNLTNTQNATNPTTTKHNTIQQNTTKHNTIQQNKTHNHQDEFQMFDKKMSTIIDSHQGCVSCGGITHISSNTLVCQSCGVEVPNPSNTTEEEYSTSSTTTCNVNANGFIAVKMIGKGSYGCQRSLLKTCANYSKYRKLTTLKDMNNWNAQNNKQHIPKNVIQEASNTFAKIKEHGYVFRKDGKKGVLSACLYYACYNNGISKTPSEIAQFSGIEEKFHSFVDRILHDLNERKIIEIPIKINPISDYVDRYMELLEIPKKYKQFVIDLIDRAEKKHIHILHDSKNNTKCVGAIYMLVDRVPELRARITKEKIDKECGISQTTFMRYYIVLCTYYKKFKIVFKKHKIPMKNEWRDAKTT